MAKTTKPKKPIKTAPIVHPNTPGPGGCPKGYIKNSAGDCIPDPGA